ncbi:hypothetical protein BCR33DRAFT_327155 [Rhizoclosmatium globosum]|uniref:Uncharacterized protein n=1 Tax=Rhizoclosmatium globosum TaxID=329046 RepID=A0A1Y2C4A9_9FUNG|nr:hypothetical protein BCR33DRAFT_327155 [Rhizoclosmatium globosum]|eukprot:ORY41883.1 hypothetical protein BCR33DRAFT_327155 [Rhizoclosmatium globosum]
MSNPSMKSIHLEFGLRWDVEDYTTPAEVNNSVPQPLFNVKAGKSANISTLSISRRRSSGTPETQIPDFLAFQQKKQASYFNISSPSPQVTRRAKSPFQRRRQTADASPSTQNLFLLSRIDLTLLKFGFCCNQIAQEVLMQVSRMQRGIRH